MAYLLPSAALAAFLAMTGAGKAETLSEDFRDAPAERWEYVGDRVMGGVSVGGAEFTSESGRAFVRLTGAVSTDNNGGFIQVRRRLADPLPAATEGLAITVRGNGEAYYVHIRTTETTRPWYYYQATFTAGADWSEIRLPLADFEPSDSVLPATPDPATVTGIGLVAFGRDHLADLSVASVAVY